MMLMFAGGLLALGLVTGFLAGLLGIGGGIIMVPALHYLLPVIGLPEHENMHVAVATSLAVASLTGIVSARAHAKRGNVVWVVFRSMAVGTLLGVAVGTWMADQISGENLRLIFAGAVILLAFSIMIDTEHTHLAHHLPSSRRSMVAGSVIGFLSSLMGIAGGAINVPYLTLSGFSLHRAIGTAAALGGVITVPSMIGYILLGLDQPNLPPYSFGYVNLLCAALLLPGAVLMAPLGVRVGHHVPVKRLRGVFAVFMILVAARMLADSLDIL